MMFAYERGDWVEFFILRPRVIDGKLRWLRPAWRRKLEHRSRAADGSWRYHRTTKQYSLETPE